MRCVRCDGLLMREWIQRTRGRDPHCFGWWWRCVNCGERHGRVEVGRPTICAGRAASVAAGHRDPENNLAARRHEHHGCHTSIH